MRTSFRCSVAASVASAVVLAASGAAAMPSLPRVPKVELEQKPSGAEAKNERERAIERARSAADRRYASIGGSIATNAKIPNVHRTFAQATSGAKACYLEAVGNDRSARGFAAFRLIVAADGSVESVSGHAFSGSNLPRSVIECTMNVLLGLKFAPPTDYEQQAVVTAAATFGDVGRAEGPKKTTRPKPRTTTPKKKVVRTLI